MESRAPFNVPLAKEEASLSNPVMDQEATLPSPPGSTEATDDDHVPAKAENPSALQPNLDYFNIEQTLDVLQRQQEQEKELKLRLKLIKEQNHSVSPSTSAPPADHTPATSSVTVASENEEGAHQMSVRELFPHGFPAPPPEFVEYPDTGPLVPGDQALEPHGDSSAHRRTQHQSAAARSENESDAKKVVKATKIFVGGLPLDTTIEDLRLCFERCGIIYNIELKQGYAFVDFTSASAAVRAVGFMHNGSFMGKKIKVEPSTGGTRTARFESDRNHCFKCGEDGHYGKDCTNPPRQEGNGLGGSERSEAGSSLTGRISNNAASRQSKVYVPRPPIIRPAEDLRTPLPPASNYSQPAPSGGYHSQPPSLLPQRSYRPEYDDRDGRDRGRDRERDYYESRYPSRGRSRSPPPAPPLLGSDRNYMAPPPPRYGNASRDPYPHAPPRSGRALPPSPPPRDPYYYSERDRTGLPPPPQNSYDRLIPSRDSYYSGPGGPASRDSYYPPGDRRDFNSGYPSSTPSSGIGYSNGGRDYGRSDYGGPPGPGYGSASGEYSRGGRDYPPGPPPPASSRDYYLPPRDSYQQPSLPPSAGSGVAPYRDYPPRDTGRDGRDARDTRDYDRGPLGPPGPGANSSSYFSRDDSYSHPRNGYDGGGPGSRSNGSGGVDSRGSYGQLPRSLHLSSSSSYSLAPPPRGVSGNLSATSFDNSTGSGANDRGIWVDRGRSGAGENRGAYNHQGNSGRSYGGAGGGRGPY